MVLGRIALQGTTGTSALNPLGSLPIDSRRTSGKLFCGAFGTSSFMLGLGQVTLVAGAGCPHLGGVLAPHASTTRYFCGEYDRKAWVVPPPKIASR